VSEKGVLTPDEAMPATTYINELAQRGINIQATELPA